MRGSYRAWRDIPTRWHDNDVYGHVNNVIYYSWFDTAVNAWLVEHGLLAPALHPKRRHRHHGVFAGWVWDLQCGADQWAKLGG